MQGDAKAEYLQVEGDKYFERNLKADDPLEVTLGAKIFCDFIVCIVGLKPSPLGETFR